MWTSEIQVFEYQEAHSPSGVGDSSLEEPDLEVWGSTLVFEFDSRGLQSPQRYSLLVWRSLNVEESRWQMIQYE